MALEEYSISNALFSAEPTLGDHRAYANLRQTKVQPEVRAWLEETYSRHKDELDPDFVPNFRRETAKRVSELFFAAAFRAAGWEPVGRATGFDLAYQMGEHRLLVEVTTPGPPPSDSWSEDVRDGVTHYSGDRQTLEAGLLRLTTGFASKADRIAELLDLNLKLSGDYKVIAISGFQISQETPFAPSSCGQIPDFIRAFLPIGDQYVKFPIGPGSDEREATWGYESAASIQKPSGATVERTAFLGQRFPHVEAVAYSTINLLGLTHPHWQVGVLHNAFSNWNGQRPNLGMGNEYFVTVDDEYFEVRRCKLPGTPDD